MIWECKMCSLDGNIEPEIVFEPVKLEPSEIESFFGDKNTRKVLNMLKSNHSDFDKFKGRLFLSDAGVIALGHLEDVKNGRVIVLVKIVGKNSVIYEVNSDATFRVFFSSGDDVLVHEIKIDFLYLCFRNHQCSGVCWAVPLYILVPELYPEVCRDEECVVTSTA
ncbi:hypothetical protein [Archaeoglobus neptunius]|uniref:hypothetical protein n=1 Tax=Archaeoglobus neptunius TaxID=2798580 RepID=UPI001926351B|nr:hypothetical protein [Archaeoglobus neptunius]